MKKQDKPEWLKQWTISKGWMHNRSHLLYLPSNETKTNSGDAKPSELENSSDEQSVTIHQAFAGFDNKTIESERYDNILSKNNIANNNVPSENVKQFRRNLNAENHELKAKAKDTDFTIKKAETINTNALYKIDNDDYRRNFPKNEDAFADLFAERMGFRYAENLLYNIASSSKSEKADLTRIVECSEGSGEEGVSLYENPLYEANRSLRSWQGSDVGDGYESLHFGTIGFCRSSIDKIQKSRVFDCDRFESFRDKLKLEKCVIRHIRVRVMLSLRFDAVRLKRVKGHQQTKRKVKKKRWPRLGLKGSEKSRCDSTRCYFEGKGDRRVLWMHEEQKRIGNGVDSLKIQNMRFGRLNVLRWLVWEASVRQYRRQEREAMPALERQHSGASSGGSHVGSSGGNATLALHYAAARGCLDCVRLLVDSSTTVDLRYSIANTQMDNDVTPVYLAAQEGHLEVLKFLVLEAGGSLYVRAKDGMAPVHAASQMGCLNCVKWMIQDQGVDPNLRDGDGATPLHFAASRGHLETVRWLLKHGARLSLDKYGKSPINDAAENQQVECLNVLVQHGTTPDYKEANGTDKKYASCSCARNSSKRSNFDCSTCKRHQAEPFYLHPPLGRAAVAGGVETPHAPQDGLYINPMGVGTAVHHHRHASGGSDCGSASSTCSSTNGGSGGGGESFYLHNPQEVIYNRVKDLFPNNASLSALTVKVEVHSSSSGAGSDENTSSAASSSSDGGGVASGDDHDHDYEDIYMVREEQPNATAVTNRSAKTKLKTTKTATRSRSRDSGSHSRSGSASSTASASAGGCNVIVKLTATNNASPTSTLSDEDYNNNNRHKPLGKAASMPPPPPPLPNITRSVRTTRVSETDNEKRSVDDEDVKRGAEEVEVVEEPSVRPSDVVKGMCRSMSALSAKRLNSSCSDLTIVSLDSTNSPVPEIKQQPPTLAGKTRVLPFVPPSFPPNAGASANHLIKPSEYLKSIGKCDGVELLAACTSVPPPPLPPPLPESAPPPLPPTNHLPAKEDIQRAQKQQQPLSAISIHDINSVQLRRIDNKMAAGKTFSAPVRSMSLQSLTTDFVAQKTDLIAELKMSKDITGIRQMKIERAKVEEKQEKAMYTEISKQFSTTNFVEKIPDKDNTGNAIPAWKRQMLAKKAAERARKELEEQLQREAEEKRLSAIPQWKRQLLAKKEEAENKIRNYLYTPKVEDPSNKSTLKLQDGNTNDHEESEKEKCQERDVKEENQEEERPLEEDDESNESSEEETAIIPWRAQLRKTNSKLNLLD